MTRQYLYSCASKASDAESRCVPLKRAEAVAEAVADRSTSKSSKAK
jgi:hypothetical protein